MTRAALILGFSFMTTAAFASGLQCWGIIIGRGYSAAYRYELTPMREDKSMLSARKDQFSFVVDTFELASNNSLRLFIHDVKADYTATMDGQFKKIGSFEEIRLQQIIGYDTPEPMTVALSCNK